MGCWYRCYFEAAHCCEIDSRVLFGTLFGGVLLEVPIGILQPVPAPPSQVNLTPKTAGARRKPPNRAQPRNLGARSRRGSARSAGATPRSASAPAGSSTRLVLHLHKWSPRKDENMSSSEIRSLSNQQGKTNKYSMTRWKQWMCTPTCLAFLFPVAQRTQNKRLTRSHLHQILPKPCKRSKGRLWATELQFPSIIN